ncbi:DUF4760 domain-containing protein [Basfia succiniciproducens]|uniref:DUF4760 domain-containing protein n=1 Tax=Basfia succiniciproducens TaxID=653940 RepID=UPI003FCC88CB
MSEKLGWKIFWILIVLLVVMSIGLTITAYVTAIPENNIAILEAAKMFFLCLGGSGVVLSAYFSVATIYSSSKNMDLQRQSNIIENTFELLSRWDDPHLLEARRWTRDLKQRKPEISDNDMIKEINDNEALKQSVILVMNYLEHTRFSVLTKRVDGEKFYNSLGITLIDIAKRFSPYAKSVNEQIEKDLKELIKILESFEKS